MRLEELIGTEPAHRDFDVRQPLYTEGLFRCERGSVIALTSTFAVTNSSARFRARRVGHLTDKSLDQYRKLQIHLLDSHPESRQFFERNYQDWDIETAMRTAANLGGQCENKSCNFGIKAYSENASGSDAI
jgi:hypothetical protein